MSAKVILGMLVVVLVLCVGSAGVAGAVEWHVNGAFIPEGEGLAGATGVKVAPEFVMPGLGVTIKCMELKLKAAEIKPLNVGSGKLVFGGCATTMPMTGCSLESAVITGETVALSAAKGAGMEDLVTATPVNMAKTVGLISFSAENTCALNGISPVKGKMVLKMPKGQEERNPQEVVANTGAGELTVAGPNEIKLKMTVEVKVSTNLPWNYN